MDKLLVELRNLGTTCVKLAWQLPKATNTYLVDQMLACGMDSVRVDTIARYVKFVRSLITSPSMEVSVMCGVAMNASGL